MNAIADAIFNASDNSVLLVQDETLFRSLPPLRNMWMRCDQQVRVPTPPQNDTLCLYGALELDTGHMVTSYLFERPDSDTKITYLEDLLSEYPEQDIILIWDQATFHTSQATEAWLAEHDRLHVYLLPKYAPQLNPLETLWQHLKNRVAANLTRLARTIKSACETFFHQHIWDCRLRGVATY